MLNALLAALRRSRGTAEMRAAYDESLHRLDAGQVAAQACKPGDRMPAFLVGRDGIVRRSWVNADFTRRAEPAGILAALQGLGG